MFTRIKSLFPAKEAGLRDGAATHKKQGDEHLKSDRFADAAESYRRAVSANPDYVDACVGLGFALSEQKEYSESERYLRHALSVDRDNVDAHYILGRIAKERNDQAGAAEHFSRAVAIKPDFEFAWRELIASLFQQGKAREARDVLNRALTAYPDSAEFHFYLGNALRLDEDHDGAAASYRKALSLQPSSAESHKSLADVLRMSGHHDLAVASYQKALWFQPEYVDAHIELAGVLRLQGKLDQALASSQRVVELNPEHSGARIALGNVFEGLGKSDEAIACYRRAVELGPESAAAHQWLGNALLARGATAEAIGCYEQVVKLEPDNAIKHLVAALSGGESERAPSDYVEKLFDEYAQRFDTHLVEVLSYDDPQRLAALLAPHFDPDGKKWMILDLGCGTGLSGAAIAPFARHLVGVDLSSKMLDKARERHVYHRLEQMELIAMMRGEPESSYDLLFATDVCIYLGRLDDLASEAQRLLRPGGLFAFSVESLDASNEEAAPTTRRDYHLDVTGRYAHSRAYLTALATREGFDVLTTANTQSRLEQGKPVEGYLVLWRCPSV